MFFFEEFGLQNVERVALLKLSLWNQDERLRTLEPRLI